jgi:AraC family transcriptional regulator, transcriptional activator of pobA
LNPKKPNLPYETAASLENSCHDLDGYLSHHNDGFLLAFAPHCPVADSAQNALRDPRGGTDDGLGSASFFAKIAEKLAQRLKPMRHEFHEPSAGGQFSMTVGEPDFARYFFRESEKRFNALVWNRGEAQVLTIDEMRFEVPANTFFALNVSHSFRLERSQDAVIWQFNKEFYCIVTHDAEVSCSGLLFYGWRDGAPIFLDEQETRSFGLLVEVFKDEFENRDNIQGEMLRVLLKRLIIKLTRLVKAQSAASHLSVLELDTVRQFNLLVENHFKKQHLVQEYAQMMFKSPKTLSNLFSKYSDKTPVQIIAERLFLEAKRLILYTDKSAGEIGFELGFEEPAHFSRFFRKMSGQSPTGFKRSERGFFQEKT